MAHPSRRLYHRGRPVLQYRSEESQIQSDYYHHSMYKQRTCHNCSRLIKGCVRFRIFGRLTRFVQTKSTEYFLREWTPLSALTAVG